MTALGDHLPVLLLLDSLGLPITIGQVSSLIRIQIFVMLFMFDDEGQVIVFEVE